MNYTKIFRNVCGCPTSPADVGAGEALGEALEVGLAEVVAVGLAVAEGEVVA